jgi:hypothetical protein
MTKMKMLLGLAGCALFLIVALPASAGSINPPFPKTGKWSFGDQGSFLIAKGSGKSGKKKRYLTNFHGTTSDGSGCPATPATIELVGKHKLTIFARGGYRSWGVGKNTPSTSNGVSTIPVKVKVAGASAVDGQFSTVWDTESKQNYGAELDFSTGNATSPTCTTSFLYGSHK